MKMCHAMVWFACGDVAMETEEFVELRTKKDVRGRGTGDLTKSRFLEILHILLPKITAWSEISRS